MALKVIAKKFKAYRDARIEKMKMSFLITMIKAKLRRKLNRRMPNVAARFVRHITDSCMPFH